VGAGNKSEAETDISNERFRLANAERLIDLDGVCSRSRNFYFVLIRTPKIEAELLSEKFLELLCPESVWSGQEVGSFAEGGLAGLVPHKRGPKQAHKLADEVLAFIVETRQKEPSVRTPEKTSPTSLAADVSCGS
jgi:hypothetical protein